MNIFKKIDGFIQKTKGKPVNEYNNPDYTQHQAETHGLSTIEHDLITPELCMYVATLENIGPAKRHKNYDSVPDRLKTLNICKEFIKRSPELYWKFSDSMKKQYSIIEYAAVCPFNLHYIPEKYVDINILKIMANNIKLDVLWSYKPFTNLKDKDEIFRISLNSNGMNLLHLDSYNDEYVNIAVKSNPYVIRELPNPSYELYLLGSLSDNFEKFNIKGYLRWIPREFLNKELILNVLSRSMIEIKYIQELIDEDIVNAAVNGTYIKSLSRKSILNFIDEKYINETMIKKLLLKDKNTFNYLLKYNKLTQKLAECASKSESYDLKDIPERFWNDKVIRIQAQKKNQHIRIHKNLIFRYSEISNYISKRGFDRRITYKYNDMRDHKTIYIDAPLFHIQQHRVRTMTNLFLFMKN